MGTVIDLIDSLALALAPVAIAWALSRVGGTIASEWGQTARARIRGEHESTRIQIREQAEMTRMQLQRDES